nr:toxin TcdB middle/N-terminal domain-containing protein [Desulfonema magnum]
MFTRTTIIITLLFFAVSISPTHAGDPSPIDLSYKFSGVKAPESPYKNTWGAFQTDLFSGSFGYQYKIEAPPGTNGLAPEISLAYNSHSAKGKSGWVGAGWDIPLSYIQRDIEYTRKDTSDDTFDLYLSGSKHDLVFVPIENQYHTKIESFLKIERRTGAPNENGEYWVVTAKNGTQYRFGYNTDSENKVKTTDPEMTHHYIWRWSLDQITDSNGNCIYLKYTEIPANGEVYLTRIEYNNERKRRIEFILENREDSYLVIDQGSEVRESKRLKEIRITVNGGLVRKYAFSYETNHARNKSLLRAITQFGKDGTTSLPPVKFEYKELNPSFAKTSDWRTPGKKYIRKSEEDGDQKYDTLDINGDGLQDYVKFEDDWDDCDGKGRCWKIWMNQGTGFSSTEQTWYTAQRPEPIGHIRDVHDGSKDRKANNTRSSMMDFNRDGLPDLVRANNENRLTFILNTGNGFGNVESIGNLPTNAWIRNIKRVEVDKYGKPKNAPNVEQAFLDMNGDNLPDLVFRVKISPDDDTFNAWRVYRNTGDNFVEFGVWPVPHTHAWIEDFERSEPEEDGMDTEITTRDMNGDGLTDIVLANEYEWKVYLNSGSHFIDIGKWHFSSHAVWDDDITDVDEDGNVESDLIDINGDGLPDLVKPEKDSTHWPVSLNTGKGFGDAIRWDTPYYKYTRDVKTDDGHVQRDCLDIDGDGVTDIVRRASDTHWDVHSNQAQKIDLLVKITDTLGGTIQVDYASSKRDYYPHNLRLPFSYWVVSSLETDNGMSGPHSNISARRFSYSGGLYDYPTREFRGFATVRETQPDDSVIIHHFHQDEAKKGKAYKTELTDASGMPWSGTVNKWKDSHADGVYTTLLEQKDEHTYDGRRNNPKTVRTAYKDYDQYGNIGLEISYGDVSTGDDDLYAYNKYWLPCALEHRIVDKLKHRVVKSYISGPKLRESFYWYDHLSSCVDKGNLTKEEVWLDTGENPVTAHDYDHYGNRIETVDPEGRITRTEYDPSYHTFPEKIYNAKNQLVTRTYDPGTGNLLEETDPNGFSTRNVYDVFHRKIKEIRPYDTESLPTTEIQYSIDGVPPERVITSKREISGQPGTLDMLQFIDGFGSLIQTKTEYENPANRIAVDVFYDEMGRVERQSNPYLTDNSQEYSAPDTSVPAVVYEYDVPGRPITVINPDQTRIRRKFDHWTVTEWDENNHAASYRFDAQQRLLNVTENNRGESYITRYEYKSTGELVQITDHLNNVTSIEYDSLGRKTYMNDPDMGQWRYEYDKVGNLILQTDARGITTQIKYDLLNRKTLVDYPNDTDIHYTYDLDVIGTLSQVLDSAGLVRYQYDHRLRKTQEDRSVDEYTWTTQWAYDASDRITTQTYPNEEAVAFHYNSQGNLDSIPGIVSKMDYNAGSQVIRKEYANGQSTTYAYNHENQRLEKIHAPGIQDFQYTYDDVGNVRSIADGITGLTEVFAYDDLDRLTHAEDAEYRSTYEYNAVGNLTTETKDGETITYDYGENAGPHAVTGKTTPIPVVGSFALNNGDIYVTMPQVTLNNIAFGDPTEYMVSEDKTFADASWKPYAEAPAFTLSSGYGLKTVYFKVRNADGESRAKSDDIEFLLDTDGDTIPDKYDEDDDNDGIPDTWEKEHDMDPLDPEDAKEDYDGDQLSNFEEYKHGSDILSPDSDGDGWDDYDEVYVYHTDPANHDTDGDGIIDSSDVSPLNPYHYPESEDFAVMSGNFNEGADFRNESSYMLQDRIGRIFTQDLKGEPNIISKEIDHNGGTVVLQDGSARAEFPPGAVSERLTITIKKLEGPATPPPNGGFVLIGSAYEITAEDSEGNPVTVFDEEIEISLKYYPESLGEIDESELKIHYFDEDSGQWIAMQSELNLDNHTVTILTDHLTKFAIFAPEPINKSPEILSEAEDFAYVDEEYIYDVEAEDPEGDMLTFELTEYPAGMSIDPETGLITWTPDSSQVGDHDTEVRVSDGNSFSEQRLTVLVTTSDDDPDSIFTAGIFTVGDDGLVQFDWLYDGGMFEGELGVFSLSGMEAFEPNSPAFIEEAVRRALSDSEEGCIVISDPAEGARFSGLLGGESEDWNEGEYGGLKLFEMKLDDKFATILVPNSTFQELYENPGTGDSHKRPLFSLASSNPEHGMHLGQIADINGSGHAFVYEDMQFVHSDRDYNDLIFQVSGAKGDAPCLDDLIASGVMNPEDDWRRDANDSDDSGELAGEIMQCLEYPRISVTLASDILFVFTVYDSENRECGKEKCTIPDAEYEVGDDGSQRIFLPVSDESDYRVVIRGAENGTCNLTVAGYQGNVDITSETKVSEIGAFQSFKSFISFSEKQTIRFEALTPCMTANGNFYDFDCDGGVDEADINVISSKWNTCEGDIRYDSTLDLDGDGCITILDIMTVINSMNSR